MRRAILLSALGVTLSACANMQTISMSDQIDKKMPVTVLRGDAKQTQTVLVAPVAIKDNKGVDTINRQSAMLGCPGRDPPVFSVHSGDGALSIGSKTNDTGISLSGSASEVGAVINPLAAVQMNQDNANQACWDRLNGWSQPGNYETDQMRARNITLAAFAFQALSNLNSPTGTPIESKADTSAQNSGSGSTDKTKDAASDASSSSSSDAPAATQSDSSSSSASPGGGSGGGKSKAVKKPVATKASSPSIQASATANNVGGSAATATSAADAIVKIYDMATNRNADVTPFCIRALTEDGYIKADVQDTKTVQQQCGQILLLQAASQAANGDEKKASEMLDKVTGSNFPSTTIYWQVPAEAQLDSAQTIVTAMRANGYHVVAKIEQVSQVPNSSQIRYYYDSDAAAVNSLVKWMSQNTTVTPVPVKFKISSANTGLIEIWISKKDMASLKLSDK